MDFQDNVCVSTVVSSCFGSYTASDQIWHIFVPPPSSMLCYNKLTNHDESIFPAWKSTCEKTLKLAIDAGTIVRGSRHVGRRMSFGLFIRGIPVFDLQFGYLSWFHPLRLQRYNITKTFTQAIFTFHAMSICMVRFQYFTPHPHASLSTPRI